MHGAVEIDRVDTATLNVRVEDGAALVVVTESDHVADKLLGFDARERRVQIARVADVDRVDLGHSRVDDECVELFTIAPVRAHLAVSAHANGARAVEQAKFPASAVVHSARIRSLLTLAAVNLHKQSGVE